MMIANLTSELDGQVWSIGIDRPDKRNALNGTMFDALANALRLAQGDVRVHCVLLHGTGDCFCAGHDTAAFGALWPQSADGAVARCIRAFAEQPKPLVAAVNGAAVGFGATMLLHADWVVAGESAMFRFPFADLGIVPEAGATALLARRVGDLVARETHEQNVARVKTASAALAQAETARDQAALNLARTTVRSTVTGTVTNLDLHPGDFVAAGQQGA